MGHIGEEVLIGYLYLVGLSHKFLSDANELGDTPLDAEVAHLSIESLWRRARLENIAEDEGLLRGLTTLHEVEGDVEGVDVTIVGVVDEDTAALTFLHLEAHGDGLKTGHTLGQLLRTESKMQSDRRTGDGILDRSLVDERNLKGMLLTLPNIANLRHLTTDSCLLSPVS